MKHRHAIDGLRGVAVAAVVVYHFAPSVLPGGFLGVDLFFVLSGFLITSLLLAERRKTRRVDITAFWGRRARRLLPAALLTLVAIAVYSAVTGSASAALRGDLIASMAYANNWHQIFSGDSYFALFGAPSPTKHFWSLAIEEQFYVVWPLLIALGIALLTRGPGWQGRRRRARLLAGLAIAAVGIVSATLLWVRFVPGDDPTRAYFGTDTRAFELLIGALLAVIIGSPERIRSRAVLAVGGGVAAVACGVAFFRLTDDSAVYYRGGAVLWSLGAAVLVLALLPDGPLARVFSTTPLRLLGLISYGVYLFHYPVLVWVNESSTGLSGVVLFTLRVAITLGVATVSFVLLETPIRRRRVLASGWPARLAVPVAAAAALLLIVWIAVPTADTDSLAQSIDLTAGDGSPPNTAIVYSDSESASGGATTTTDPMAAIYNMAAWDAAQKQATAASTPPTTVWTPPPLPYQVPRNQARGQADISVVNACAGKLQPPLAEYRNNGTGRLVAVLGDSMTVQMRQNILNDKRYDWFLVARCGTAAYHFDHPDASGGIGLQEAFAGMLFKQPQALIIALGITDVSRKVDYSNSIPTLLDQTKDVPCRSWVTLWPNPGVENYMPGGIQAFQDFDDALAKDTAGTGVKLLDWGARATQVPENQYGYHPWLNPTDWVHLLPGQGFEQRLALMETGLDGCFG